MASILYSADTLALGNWKRKDGRPHVPSTAKYLAICADNAGSDAYAALFDALSALLECDLVAFIVGRHVYFIQRGRSLGEVLGKRNIVNWKEKRWWPQEYFS